MDETLNTYKITELEKGEFPSSLAEIPQPPKKLFIAGDVSALYDEKILLTVVGSRKYTNYGQEVCERLIAGLSGYDITIVSGLAIGIDTVAHKAALNTGLQTVAVPGSGLGDNVLYPRMNRLLAKKIVKSGGALLSEFKPDFKATVWSFPQRNRIMAGLAQATLVIEAVAKSGTLITARLALDYNKDVFTVPGSIFSSNSIGTNMLMRQGAMPVTSSKDILNELGFDAVSEDERGAGVAGASGTTSPQQKLNLANCSPDEKRTLEILSHEPLARDELIHKLNIPISKVNILLSAMEIKGLIKESGGLMRVS